jgi:hypothetical protein
MSNRGQSQYLRIFDNSGTQLRWQNYYVGQTVTWQANSWTYHPFTVDGIIGGAGSGNDIAIELPATSSAVAAFTSALNNNRLCEVLIYEFDSRLTQAAPQATQSLIATFVGEVVKISGSFMAWTITVGSSLAPVGAQVPPRKFTNSLVGLPIKL